MTPVELPRGTVTFLFTDIEGSTSLLRELGAEGYAQALAEHRRVLREAFGRYGGVEVDTQGDAFFYVFSRASDAIEAAKNGQAELGSGPVRVRVGLHTGEPTLVEEGYVGLDVHKAARIAAAGHGGQVLLSQATRDLSSAETKDLGPHRLKDLSAPERIFQLGAAEFPPLRSLYQTNLPVPATPFLGRAEELAEVVALVSQDDVKLVTLTGPAGAGKTRLGLQAAAEAAEEFPDGIAWVPLAPLRDEGLVPFALAEVLHVQEQPGEALIETIASSMRGKRAAVLLDNAEHVLAGAAQVAGRLRDADGPTVIVTSRERLQLQGEHVWAVPPLSERDGLALFAARARQLDPAFSPSPAADELCRRLDQLPLALELAAARTQLFAPEQLLERLSERLDLLKGGGRDADPRQQTLRATIAWSHDLLADDERQLFRRFAVFAGGCPLDAAENVAEAAPDTLLSLLDKSLLRRRATDVGPRFWMLETIRAYAVEELERSGETDATHSRHAEWLVRLSEQAEPEVLRGDQVTWGHRLDAERDNCRVGLAWLLQQRRGEQALRLIGALRRAWAARGFLDETRRWLEAALAFHQGVDPRVRAKALYGLGRVALLQGDYDEAVRGLGSAGTLYRDLADAEGLVYSLADLGWIAGVQGDHERATALAEESLGHARRTGDDVLVSAALHSLACAHLDRGEYGKAQPLFEESLARRRRLRDKRNTANSLLHLGTAALLGGDYPQAKALLEESLDLARELENLVLEAAVLVVLGLVALFEDARERGVDLIRNSLSLSARVGDKRTIVECLHALAAVSAASGDAPRAAVLSGAAEGLLEVVHTPPSVTERAVCDRFLASVRTESEAYAEGGQMSLDQAVEFALEDGNA